MAEPLSHGDALRSVWWIPVVGVVSALAGAVYNHGWDFSFAGLILNALGNTTACALVVLVVCAFAESRSSEEFHKKRWATRS